MKTYNCDLCKKVTENPHQFDIYCGNKDIISAEIEDICEPCLIKLLNKIKQYIEEIRKEENEKTNVGNSSTANPICS